VLAFLVTPILSQGLRMDWDFELAHFSGSLLIVTLLFLVIKLGVLYRAGLYSRFWRYASIDEMGSIIRAGVYILGIELVTFFFLLRPLNLVTSDFPRSIPLLDSMLSILAVGGLRYSIRLTERLHERQSLGRDGRRVLVIGAGEAGMLMVKEMQGNPRLGLLPVGFVDDAPEKQNMRIRGVQVLGTCREIGRLVRDTGAEEVIIAMPRAPGKAIREVVGLCEQVGVRAKIMPGMYEILGGQIHVNQLRNVEITDLLRREPVQIDSASVEEIIRGKRVLVTGGGGSIGSEICRQVLSYGPAELILIGHGENSLFEITQELQRLETIQQHRQTGGQQPSIVRPIVADIRSASRIHTIFAQVRPEVVFHAAAHKHVPLMEANASEAVTNNIFGTRNVVAAACAVGVERFVMLSTDKAVNPTSVMGASKRAAELIVHEAAHITGKPYAAVRFGNVLGSRGSVLLTFSRQIAAGGPLTITHPDIERFFMTIPEAVQLVLQAAVLGHGGEVFVLDMGDPIKIIDLARDVISLSGLELGRDIDIIFTGLRPGEKLYEELFVPGEEYARTQHEKVFIAANAGEAVPHDLATRLAALHIAADQDDDGAIIAGLRGLVPEFHKPEPLVPVEAARPEQRAREAARATRMRVTGMPALGTDALAGAAER
jgi:FlaA1/EpsC-like NDP-sugar epimerase